MPSAPAVERVPSSISGKTIRIKLPSAFPPAKTSQSTSEARFIHLHHVEHKAYAQSMIEVGSEPEAVRQLQRVLASHGFSRNERLSRFLRFIVEQHLEGKDPEVKESVIALEVFGRPDHDPQKDSIVRTEASRLRARLSEYYLGPGKDDAVIIELPKGAYVPVTRSADYSVAAIPAMAGPVSQSKIRTIGVVATVVIVLTGMSWWWLRRQSSPIPIAVLPLANLNQDPANDFC